MLYNNVQKKRYTIVPIKLFWMKAWCKLKIGIVQGKSIRDKRLDKKKYSWKQEKNIVFKRLSFNEK